MGYYEGVTEALADSLSRDELIATLKQQNVKWVKAEVYEDFKEATKQLPVIDVISATLDRRVRSQHRIDKRNRRRK